VLDPFVPRRRGRALRDRRAPPPPGLYIIVPLEAPPSLWPVHNSVCLVVAQVQHGLVVLARPGAILERHNWGAIMVLLLAEVMWSL